MQGASASYSEGSGLALAGSRDLNTSGALEELYLQDVGCSTMTLRICPRHLGVKDSACILGVRRVRLIDASMVQQV
jgi:hypothetical protein